MAHITRQRKVGNKMVTEVKMRTDKGQDKFVQELNAPRLAELGWSYAATSAQPKTQYQKDIEFSKKMAAMPKQSSKSWEITVGSTNKGKESWKTQPTLTIDGKTYQYGTPGEYGAKLKELQSQGYSSRKPWATTISQFEKMQSGWKSQPTAPTTPPAPTKEPTLIEITSQRPDVLTEARKQGGDPYKKGTKANTWLNDWYNRVGKAEGADMASKGMFTTTPETPTTAPTTAPSVQTAKPAIEDVNKNIGTLDTTLEFYQKEGESAIYKDKEMKAGTEFTTEKEFTEAGGTPYWKPGFEGVSNVRQIKPTGDIVNDRRIAEVNQTISETPGLFSTGYEPTLIEIAEARPDVLEVARAQGGDPYTAGTPANTWLNDWYNSVGKAEGADMVRQGILRPKTDTGTPAIDTTEVINAQDAVDEAIRAASEARDSEDYIAFKEAMEDLKASRATLQTNLDTLYADQKKFREQYLESLKPTIAETDLQNQLLDIRAEIDQTVLNAQAGINKVTGQPIPQGFVTGQSKAIADAANLTLQTQGVQEKNLIDRLGIEVGKRKATTEALAAGLGFIGEDLNMQMQIQNRLDNQEQTLLNRFERYEDKQKKDAVTILTALAGIDPNTLSPEALTKLAQIAQQLGISLTDILAGLQLQFDQVSFDNALMLAKLTPEEKELDTQIVTAGGRSLLVNKQTGETIRDLGGAYKPTAPTGVTEEDQTIIDAYTNQILNDEINLNNVPADYRNQVAVNLAQKPEITTEWSKEIVQGLKEQGLNDDEILNAARQDGKEEEVRAWLEEGYSGGVGQTVIEAWKEAPESIKWGLEQMKKQSPAQWLKSWLK